MTTDEPAAESGLLRRGGTRLAGAGVLGLVVVLAASGVLLLRVAEAIVPRTRVEAIESREHQPDPAATEAAVEPITGLQDVLIVGLDSRKGLTEEEIDEISAGHFDSELTDTIMWAQYDAEETQLRLVSFPRDLRVHPDGGPAVKLNSLHHYGGPDLLVSTVEEIVGTDLDHYVQVDLAGFLHLAEAVGGVEVCLEEPMVDPKSGLDLPAGCQDLDAAQSTGFVRARQVSDRFGTGTAGRGARQQYFIRQAVSEVVTAGTLTSPGRVRALIDLARQSVVVDEGFSTRELLQFANAFRSFEAERIVGANVPFTSERFDDGLFYDELAPGSQELFEALRQGDDLPADVVTTEGETDESVSIADGARDTTAQ